MKVTVVFFTFLVGAATVVVIQYFGRNLSGNSLLTFGQLSASTILSGNLTSSLGLNSLHATQDNVEKEGSFSSNHNVTLTNITNTHKDKNVPLSDLMSTEKGIIPTNSDLVKAGGTLLTVKGGKSKAITRSGTADKKINGFPDKESPLSTSERSNSQKCKYDFKVYVYEVPWILPSVRIAAEARVNQTLHICKKCILEQFALEYIVTDFFLQFCGRTFDPTEADFFYLPLIRDAEYRQSLGSEIMNKREPSDSEKAYLDMFRGNTRRWITYFNVTDAFWKARGGSDHIIVMPAPVTNFRHESGKRGFYHYISHLYTPIFLSVEYSLSFVKEYPICGTEKNIILPYPMTDPDFFNGKLYKQNISRTALLYYAGGIHGDCVLVRKAMKALMINSTSIPGVLPDVKSVQAEREHGFRAATFCPVPIGDSPSSKRMYDVMNFGCIPVVLSDDLLWAFSQQSGGPLDHASFAIHMPQAVVQFPAEALLKKYKSTKSLLGTLPGGESIYDLLETSHNTGGSLHGDIHVNALVQILLKVTEKNIAILRSGVRAAAPNYRYYLMNSSMQNIPTSDHSFPNGGATSMLALQLSQIKAVGTENIRTRCLQERRAKHKYIDHYPCDYSLRR